MNRWGWGECVSVSGPWSGEGRGGPGAKPSHPKQRALHRIGRRGPEARGAAFRGGGGGGGGGTHTHTHLYGVEEPYACVEAASPDGRAPHTHRNR